MAKNPKNDKAYENLDFINSTDGRTIRLLAEYLEPRARFKKHKIMDTIVFFGSARLMSRRDAQAALQKLQTANPKSIPNFGKALRQAQRGLEMSRYYEDAVELSRRLTEWSMNLETSANRFIVCTGGGPGIMEAANRGAKKAGGYSIGLNISIPFEQFVNKYVTKDLSFEFHYFFMRKFWFAYLSKALVVFPGGFGTMDELFEILTLVQTDKIRKKLALIIYDEKYWKSIINFDNLIFEGVISESDMKLFHFSNNLDDAFKIITTHLEKHFLKEKEPEIIEPKLHIK
ncbi:MAG TPA: TIGR00730 family Rossman fold protein [Ignavibacteriaceae bacterium]|nr:TIGR00730 family Rossman fold protein [Ignavibacteriaceae bacterium]